MKIAIFLFNILFISFLNARPISYADSWTLMSYNDYKKNSILIHYTPTSKYSIGYKSQYWQEEQHWLNSFNLNYLLKRINKKSSQANFYLKTGLGLLKSDYKEYNNKKELISYAEFATDWETRKYFVSYNNIIIRAVTVDGLFMQKARIGYAPYVTGYGNLHTWLIYEIQHMPENKKNNISNFIVRLFKSTNMIEVGLDENRNATFNYIKRF